MVYDSTKDTVLLWGGMSKGGGLSSDSIWVLEPRANAWTELLAPDTAPSPRSHHAMAYDPGSETVLLFGGIGGPDGGTTLNDTWVYDTDKNSWSEVHPVGESPPARHGHTMVYDPGSRNILLFGGALKDSSSQEGVDTWAYDARAKTWTELHPLGALPSARCYHSTVWDPVARRVFLFGGAGGAGEPGALADTWAYDPRANAWTELRSSGAPPSARSLHALAYDPASGRVIVFGGQGGGYLGDTWAYDCAADAWTEIHTSGGAPSARAASSAVGLSASAGVILFGGVSGRQDVSDAWRFQARTRREGP
jgi:hypothetical protein